MTALPRLATQALRASMGAMPVSVVMGARQTGKTTLVQVAPELDDRPYLTLDDLDVRDQARRTPTDLLGRGEELILDEVQRAPELLLAIKRSVDADRPRRPGRFVLTGSANLLLMHRVAESLAGRAAYVDLWPLTRRELLGAGTAGRWSDLLATDASRWLELLATDEAPRGDWRDLVRVGGFPTPAYELDTPEARAIWFAGYVRTYLERDLQALASIANLADFRRLMRIAALRVGGIQNQADLARDAGLSRPTAHRYLNLLETSYQLVRLHPYAVNRTKRLVKAPRLYWGDTGLALHLSGGDAPAGGHLENLVLLDLLAWRDAHAAARPQILYWRTTVGDEVDFVIEQNDRLVAVEVKATRRPTAADARHLRTFAQQYGNAVHGALLLHDGEETTTLAPGVVAAPWWRVV